jgi:ankyrin repeat protein
MTKKQRDRMLWEGCESGDYNKVRLAINFGADVGAKDNDGWTPLHFACLDDNLECAELLLDRGADVEAKTDDGWTPLHFADDDEMEALLKKYIK